MDENKVVKMLDLMVELVADTIPWTEKSEKFQAIAANNKEHEIAFEEFISWFAGEDFG